MSLSHRWGKSTLYRRPSVFICGSNLLVVDH
jgi:hypothetical protein